MAILKEALRAIGSRLPIGRFIEGEVEGKVDPRKYGFGVIREEPLSETEQAVRIGDLYTKIKKRNPGLIIPSLEKYLPICQLPVIALEEKHKQLQYPYHCTFGGAKLTIDKGVFCPTLTNVSPLLLDAIDFRVKERVLDVFAGSGAFGIIAAMKGSDIVTVDKFDRAVSCTLKNAALNNVLEKVDARLGTMQECLLPEEKFDLIIANPPLLNGEPQDEFTSTIFDSNLQATGEFFDSLRQHLEKNGRSYLATSSRSDLHLNYLLAENGLTASQVAYSRHEYETYSVHRITHQT